MSAERPNITRIFPELYHNALGEDGLLRFDKETHYVFADDQQPPRIVEVSFNDFGDLGGDYSVISSGPVSLEIFEQQVAECLTPEQEPGSVASSEYNFESEFSTDKDPRLLPQERRNEIAHRTAIYMFVLADIMIEGAQSAESQ